MKAYKLISAWVGIIVLSFLLIVRYLQIGEGIEIHFNDPIKIIIGLLLLNGIIGTSFLMRDIENSVFNKN
jgi:uncharacterized membrane protein